jgi:2,5-dihydroxypyridine 5,6-dioxygenase
MPYAHLPIGETALVELVPIFRHQLEYCRLEPGERLIAITDGAFHPHYAAACVGAALDLGAEAFQVCLPQRRVPSGEVLRSVFQTSDLIVYSTSHGLHYRREMREALEAGKRALMAVVPPHVLARRTADPEVIARASAGARVFDRAESIQIRSAAGTKLNMSVEGRRGVASYGAADRAGHLDFWGAGMFQVALVEGTLEGTLVLDTGDQVFHFGRYVDRPVTISFESGRAVSFEGGVDARLIREHLASSNEESAFMAGHIACGVDRRALWTAESSQFPVAGGGGADAEAFYGSVQVQLGSNDDVMFRGENRSSVHLGLCLLECSLSLNGETLLERGSFVPEKLR